ncbi:MAG TPA: Pycsar system effector family protein [Rhizomicrobium sp.]|nr:Pycsar system effector family protein [Rhizomicrobium sp.]
MSDDAYRASGDRGLSLYVSFEREVLHDNIALCDQKSGILLAFSAAMVVFCLQAIPSATADALDPLWRSLLHGLYLLGTAGFFFAAYFSLRVIRPRLHRNDDDLIYWDSKLFRLSESEFVSKMPSLAPDALDNAMRQHLHVLADVCRRKFANMRYSIRSGEIAFVAVVGAELIRVLK